MRMFILTKNLWATFLHYQQLWWPCISRSQGYKYDMVYGMTTLDHGEQDGAAPRSVHGHAEHGHLLYEGQFSL